VAVSDQPRQTPAHIAYSEQLKVPFRWYLAGLCVGILLAAEFAFALNGWVALVPVVLLVPASLAVVRKFSTGRLVVADGRLTAGDAALELTSVRQTFALAPDGLRRLVGRHADPAAHLYIRSWIGPGVQLILDPDGQDEDATVPYWVVSTRHPDRLISAVTAAQAD